MPAKPSGKIRTDTVRLKQKNGDIYIVERQSIYDPEKKYNRIISSHLISKIPKGEEDPVPTRPKRNGTKSNTDSGQPSDTATFLVQDASSEAVGSLLSVDSYSSLEESARNLSASRMKVGMMYIIAHVGLESGIDEALYRSADQGTAQKIISLARYLVCTNGQTLPGISVWQYTHRLPYEDGISEDVYHELFVRIGRDEVLQQKFFAARTSALGEKAVLAYDSTTISTYSKSLPEARQGFNKDHDGLDTIKLLILYSIDTRQPVAFTKQPGNLPDITSISNALKQLEVLGVSKAEIVTDNGYCSEQNLSTMLQKHFDFITLIKTSIKWVKPELDRLIEEDAFRSIHAAFPGDPSIRGVRVTLTREFIKTRKYASSSKGIQKGDKEVFCRRIYLHLYFSPRRRVEHDEAMDRDLYEIKTLIEDGTPLADLSASAQEKANKYLTVHTRGKKTTVDFRDKEIEGAKKYHGYFALVSNCEKDTFICLTKYRKRETIEFFFKETKEKTDGARPRVWETETLRGRMFVQFIAMCYYEDLSDRIRKVKKKLEGDIRGTRFSKTTVDQLKKLYVWLNETPVHLVLKWFDVIEQVDVSTKLTKKRWSTEITERDALFLLYFWSV